jgi:hypothetical protein
MDASKANPREHERQNIDAEIKSLEQSIRALKFRRNALAPISSLPTEVFAAIFSLLRLPGTTSAPAGEPDHHLAWSSVTHVCHQWREITLNDPLLWRQIDFTNITLAGAAEMLTRAKKAPLHLEARVTGQLQDDARFIAFEKALQSRVSHLCHVTISADSFYLHRTLERLASPAPTLEYLSLSTEKIYRARTPVRTSISSTLFDGVTPRLSFLILHKCDISWKSPLLKGLRYLEIRAPSMNARPSLPDWLDTLDKMPQLRRLVLHSASPIAPPFPFNIERTVTLSFLTRLDISASAGDCVLVLSHLVLPALTQLCLTARSDYPNGVDVLDFLPYVARHAHGPQYTKPLQSILIRCEKKRIDVLAWPRPDIDVELRDLPSLLAAKSSARVSLSVTCRDWLSETHIGVLDAAMATLPLDNLVILTVHGTRLDERVWLSHAPRWPLLERVRLAPRAARGLREMFLLQDQGQRESPLLPSLTRLDLIDDTALSARRTLRLCDALMKRVEQGVPLEVLDLRKCLATSHAVRLLSEIVVDVLGPEEALGTRRVQRSSTWVPEDRGHFVYDDDSEEESSDDEEEVVEIEED